MDAASSIVLRLFSLRVFDCRTHSLSHVVLAILVDGPAEFVHPFNGTCDHRAYSLGFAFEYFGVYVYAVIVWNWTCVLTVTADQLLCDNRSP